MSKYCYRFDGEDYNEGYDTIKQTLKEARLACEGEESQVWIAETTYPQPLIDVDNVLDELQDQAYDMGSDYAGDYLDDVKNEDLKELKEELNAVFFKWQNKHNYQPRFFNFKNEKLYDLKTGKEIK